MKLRPCGLANKNKATLMRPTVLGIAPARAGDPLAFLAALCLSLASPDPRTGCQRHKGPVSRRAESERVRNGAGDGSSGSAPFRTRAASASCRHRAVPLAPLPPYVSHRVTAGGWFPDRASGGPDDGTQRHDRCRPTKVPARPAKLVRREGIEPSTY